MGVFVWGTVEGTVSFNSDEIPTEIHKHEILDLVISELSKKPRSRGSIDVTAVAISKMFDLRTTVLVDAKSGNDVVQTYSTNLSGPVKIYCNHYSFPLSQAETILCNTKVENENKKCYNVGLDIISTMRCTKDFSPALASTGKYQYIDITQHKYFEGKYKKLSEKSKSPRKAITSKQRASSSTKPKTKDQVNDGNLPKEDKSWFSFPKSFHKK